MSKFQLDQLVQNEWKLICRLGGISVLVQLLCVMSTLIVIFTLDGEPATIEAYFSALDHNLITALLRMDCASLVSVTLYPFTFMGLFAALRKTALSAMTLATSLGFCGIVLWLGAHSAFSIISLHSQYTTAATEVQRAQILAAGQAIIAADMWHSTGAVTAGFFMQTSLLITSIVMLTGTIFNKATAIVGILTHGLDLVHILIGVFAPAAGAWLMFAAGPLYPVWFVLIAIRLFQLSK